MDMERVFKAISSQHCSSFMQWTARETSKKILKRDLLERKTQSNRVTSWRRGHADDAGQPFITRWTERRCIELQKKRILADLGRPCSRSLVTLRGCACWGGSRRGIRAARHRRLSVCGTNIVGTTSILAHQFQRAKILLGGRAGGKGEARGNKPSWKIGKYHVAPAEGDSIRCHQNLRIVFHWRDGQSAAAAAHGVGFSSETKKWHDATTRSKVSQDSAD